MLLALACLLAVPANARAWQIQNAWWRVQGEGAVITEARADPGGKGAFTARFAGRLYAGETPPAGGAAQPVKTGRRGERQLIVRGADFLAQPRLDDRADHRDEPIRLSPGARLAQSFTAGDGLAKVEVCLPTYYQTGSQATVTLRKGDAAGPVVASRRLHDIADNGWHALTCPPQPAGRYLLELADPGGEVGWWAERGDPLPDGQAYVDGKPQAGLDFDLKHTCFTVQRADLEVMLAGPVLYVTPSIPLRLRLETPWQVGGYGIEDRSRHWFRRFLTDRGQWLPAEQLKRRGVLDFPLVTPSWLHLGGNWGADWRLDPCRGRVDPVMGDGLLTLQLADRLGVKVMRPGWQPAWLPRFETPDARLTATLNSFLWDRALSWPLDSGSPTWMEWLALIRDWMALPDYLPRERAHLLAYKMTPEGYVYTWGDSPMWPFPDNTKYDVRHFDTNAMFILGCYRYSCWTGDLAFLRENRGRLERAMAFQLGALQGQGGMLVQPGPDHDGTPAGVPDNYWDDLPFGYQSAYENIYFSASLSAMADMADALGDGRQAAELRALHARAVETYRRTFWNDAAGRFIGCIDRTGVVHDSGFTYVNLEAMAYGLATPGQGRRICRWLDTGITHTGRADTYTAYRFAPRVNTEDTSGWWYHHGQGEIKSQQFGTHCENGGAILYTTGFDLMARARYLSADNALARLRVVLDRYREADRLCGGPPLLHGENNGWEVGTDVPFPESGLAPAAFLYAFLGVQAAPGGLHVRPNLPAAWPWAGVRNLRYRGLPLDLRVTRDRVRVQCRQPGYEFTISRHLPPGGEYVLSQLPGGRPWPPVQPASAWRATWIWGPAETVRISARKRFTLPRLPRQAVAWVTADDQYVLLVNGRRAAAGGDWHHARRVDLRPFLRVGENVIALQGTNSGGGPAGLLLEGRLDGAPFTTNGSWRVSNRAPAGWAEPGFDDRNWPAARPLGRAPTAPWGEVAGGPG